MNPSSSRTSASSQGPSPSAPSAVRPASSASVRPIRPSSSSHARPLSSASLRPPSSASSIRPSSSASSARPLSSLSSRPSSRLTQRPGSRLARPPTRQSSRLLSLYDTLVSQITGLSAANDLDNFRTAVDFVSRNLDQTIRPTATSDMATVDKRIQGRIQKARINSQDSIATALETSHRKLKTQAEKTSDLDAEIKMSRLPDHLQLLILLSCRPERATINFAQEYLDTLNNPSDPQPTLTWQDILAEEPFEGQHWEGAYGLPPGSTVEDWGRRSGGSTPSLSPWDNSDEDDLDDSLSLSDVADSTAGAFTPPVHDVSDPLRSPRRAYAHRKDVEELQSRQYWRAEWRTDASTSRPFDIGDASTLGPSVYRMFGERLSLTIDNPSKEKYIHELDAVREVLMGLQGRSNMILTWVREGTCSASFVPSSSTRLLHLTATAQSSILMPFAEAATTVEHLRKFVSAIFSKASLTTVADPTRPVHLASRRVLLTLEAFSEAVDFQIREFDKWCAGKEEEMCMAQGGIGPPLVVSLLSLEKVVRDRFSAAFSVILDVLQEVFKRALRSSDPLPEIWALPDLPMRVSPSVCTALLLDLLLDTAQQYTSMGDTVTADALMRVFCDTAEPLWAMAGRWMKDGMPVRDVLGPEALRVRSVDDEFFVEDNELVMLDPDFWAEGFTLRGGAVEDGGPASVPAFLTHVAEIVLSTGKVVGLLRALGIAVMLDHEAEQQWMASWRPFRALLAPSDGAAGSIASEGRSVTFSTDSLSRLIYDELLPHSLIAHDLLTRVLVEDCDLWLHLSAMEDLYLMRRGDALSHFTDMLFARMDSRQPWNDFHFLNSAFRDVADAGTQRWIDASLVRFSHRGSKDKTVTRTIRAIDGLLVEYAVPFPLTYIFGPSVLRTYSAVFAFVLQIRRAKNVLERILVRGVLAGTARLGSELKVFYAMRSKLSWFVNTLLDFIATSVLHTQLLAFHKSLRQAKSLDDILQLHDEHLHKIEGRCLLQRNTAALQRAILSILDMTLHFSECFVAFAGDTTHDISRQSLIMLKHHRSRRARRQRRNVVGFAQAAVASDSDSDSDADADAELGGGAEGASAEPSFSFGASFAEDGFVARLDKMGTELDALVRFVRRGVESLAGGAGEAASAFGVFAFALQDWDR